MKIADKAKDIADTTKGIVNKSKDSIINAVDANNNGEIDIEDFIILGLRTPGIRVNRSDFLQKELFKNYPQDVIEDAISHNPAHAKIPVNEIDKIADEVIKFERNCVSGISTALGMPGGVAMVATIPADIVKSVSKWFGVHMTKEVFAGFFKKAIPVVGGVIGGGITFLSFKPCCDKLKESLRDTFLSNPEHQSSEEECLISDAIELPQDSTPTPTE